MDASFKSLTHLSPTYMLAESQVPQMVDNMQIITFKSAFFMIIGHYDITFTTIKAT